MAEEYTQEQAEKEAGFSSRERAEMNDLSFQSDTITDGRGDSVLNEIERMRDKTDIDKKNIFGKDVNAKDKAYIEQQTDLLKEKMEQLGNLREQLRNTKDATERANLKQQIEELMKAIKEIIQAIMAYLKEHAKEQKTSIFGKAIGEKLEEVHSDMLAMYSSMDDNLMDIKDSQDATNDILKENTKLMEEMLKTLQENTERTEGKVNEHEDRAKALAKDASKQADHIMTDRETKINYLECSKERFENLIGHLGVETKSALAFEGKEMFYILNPDALKNKEQISPLLGGEERRQGVPTKYPFFVAIDTTGITNGMVECRTEQEFARFLRDSKDPAMTAILDKHEGLKEVLKYDDIFNDKRKDAVNLIKDAQAEFESKFKDSMDKDKYDLIMAKFDAVINGGKAYDYDNYKGIANLTSEEVPMSRNASFDACALLVELNGDIDAATGKVQNLIKVEEFRDSIFDAHEKMISSLQHVDLSADKVSALEAIKQEIIASDGIKQLGSDSKESIETITDIIGKQIADKREVVIDSTKEQYEEAIKEVNVCKASGDQVKEGWEDISQRCNALKAEIQQKIDSGMSISDADIKALNNKLTQIIQDQMAVEMDARNSIPNTTYLAAQEKNIKEIFQGNPKMLIQQRPTEGSIRVAQYENEGDAAKGIAPIKEIKYVFEGTRLYSVEMDNVPLFTVSPVSGQPTLIMNNNADGHYEERKTAMTAIMESWQELSNAYAQKEAEAQKAHDEGRAVDSDFTVTERASGTTNVTYQKNDYTFSNREQADRFVEEVKNGATVEEAKEKAEEFDKADREDPDKEME